MPACGRCRHARRGGRAMKPMQQPPVRNAKRIAYAVCSHSGEFAPRYTDLRLRGRGINLEVARFYRTALARQIGRFGRGWTCSLEKRIARQGEDVVYDNGSGHLFRFRREGASYVSPDGLYAVLLEDGKTWLLRQRFGR